MSEYEQYSNFGGLIGSLVIILVPLIVGYFLSKRLTARREGYGSVRWPIAAGVTVSLLLLVGTLSIPPESGSARVPVGRSLTVETTVTREQAKSQRKRLTEEDLLIQGRLEIVLLTMGLEKNGINGPIAMTPEIAMMDTGTMQLGVTRIRVGKVTPYAMITGLVGNELVQVKCNVNAKVDVPIGSGACADRVKKTFGFAVSNGLAAHG